MKVILKFLWFIIAIAITGCGFHLRGANLDGLPPIYINGGNSRTGIRVEMDNILRNSLKSRDQAQLTLDIIREDYQRWPLSISRQLLVQEYELIYTVDFQVTDAAGKTLAVPQSLTFSRDYSFTDTNQVLGKSNEETLLRQEMLLDASRQILAQIIVILAKQGFPARHSSQENIDVDANRN